MDIKAIDKEYIAPTYARYDVVFKEGKGSLIYDENGKKYIDMGAGIAVNTFGIADGAWEDAVISQVKKLQHTSNLYYSEPQALLAKMMCEKTGAKKIFFGNSGAEANECAIKTARKYAYDKYGEERKNIITLKDSFHGRTITTLSATGQDYFHQYFGPFTQGFYHAEPGDIAEMEQLVKEHKPCAIFIELIQGEGGIHVLEKDYVKAIEKICRENDMLLLIDEVQTGNGRTGALYAYMKYGLSPDVITTAKGLAGGLPFGAALLFDKVKDTLTAGTHGSTFGGNPVCASGALSVLGRIDDDLMADVTKKGEYIMNELCGAKGVKNVSGMGLMIGIEPERPLAEVVTALLSKGVAVLTAKTKVRLLPALNIPQDLLEQAISIIKEELAQ